MNENAKHNVSLGTLYDFNKQLILQQGKITKFQLETKKAELEDWFNENKFNDEVDFEKKLNEVRYYLTNN